MWDYVTWAAIVMIMKLRGSRYSTNLVFLCRLEPLQRSVSQTSQITSSEGKFCFTLLHIVSTELLFTHPRSSRWLLFPAGYKKHKSKKVEKCVPCLSTVIQYVFCDFDIHSDTAFFGKKLIVIKYTGFLYISYSEKSLILVTSKQDKNATTDGIHWYKIV
jgi:hypothetical protein